MIQDSTEIVIPPPPPFIAKRLVAGAELVVVIGDGLKYEGLPLLPYPTSVRSFAD